MKVLNYIFISIIIVFSSCRKSTNNNSSNSNLFENMIGVIEYTNYEPLSNKPFNIHYYIPSTVNQTTAPILFIFPGTDRNADDYLETWITLADQNGVMVFAFEFSVNYYPMSTNYQTGFILDENGFPQATSSPIVLGDPNPDWRGGIALNLNYKKLRLNAVL